jgi:hypothetical protein
MALEVVGLGVGRTGTYSLKLALEQLGFGPCHHMKEVDVRSRAQLDRWTAAAAGRRDWEQAYAGFRSAVDWPTAAFSEELFAAYPRAKFLLTVRDPARWYESFSQTIYPLVDPDGSSPPMLAAFAEMVRAIMHKTGFEVPSSRDDLLAAFVRHTAQVRRTIPADRLLVFEVAEGWKPLCSFLGVPVPDRPFPRTNDAKEFWSNKDDHRGSESSVADQGSTAPAP